MVCWVAWRSPARVPEAWPVLAVCNISRYLSGIYHFLISFSSGMVWWYAKVVLVLLRRLLPVSSSRPLVVSLGSLVSPVGRPLRAPRVRRPRSFGCSLACVVVRVGSGPVRASPPSFLCACCTAGCIAIPYSKETQGAADRWLVYTDPRIQALVLVRRVHVSLHACPTPDKQRGNEKL